MIKGSHHHEFKLISFVKIYRLVLFHEENELKNVKAAIFAGVDVKKNDLYSLFPFYISRNLGKQAHGSSLQYPKNIRKN